MCYGIWDWYLVFFKQSEEIQATLKNDDNVDCEQPFGYYNPSADDCSPENNFDNITLPS